MESPLPLERVESGLHAAVAAGLVEAGTAQRVRVAARLAGAAGPVSGEALGQALGLSRAAVHKHVDQLRAQGFPVESVAGSGYRLTGPISDLLAAEALLLYLLQDLVPSTGLPAGLPAGALSGWVAGLPCHHRARCDSTNRVLREMIKGDAPPTGALVVTDHQTQGRGRLDRIWRDEGSKDLTFSVLLRPALAPGQAHLLSLAAALAVAETLSSDSLGLPLPRSSRAPVQVKWPNDVTVQGRKLCGILLEGAMDGERLHWAIAGIGVNVNSDTVGLLEVIQREDAGGLGTRPRPVSVQETVGGPVPRAPLLAALLRRLTARWKDLESPEGRASMLAALRERDPLLGQRVEIFAGNAGTEVLSGEGVGIGAEGQLLVRSDTGETVPVYAGDVSLRPPGR